MKDMESNAKGEMSALEHLQYLNIGLFSTIRFSQSRDGLGILNQSIGEHKIGMLNVVDVVRPKLEKHFDVDWRKVDKMIRYHDVGEIEAGEIPVFKKTEADRVSEQEALDQILERFPGELGREICDVLKEKEELQTIEARIVHAIDKIEPQIIIATERGIAELRDLHQKVGTNITQLELVRNKILRNLFVEWELDVLVELLDETWERMIELGILDEDPQLKLELEVKVESQEDLEAQADKESERDREIREEMKQETREWGLEQELEKEER